MRVSNVLELLSVMFMVGISGVQGSDYTLIDSRSVESNIQYLDVRINSASVRLSQGTPTLAEIPLHMIIGGRLTKTEIMQKLSEGGILVVHKNEGNHYALFFKRSQSETTGFHLGTYDAAVHASTRMVSAGGGGCPKGGSHPPRSRGNPYGNK